MSIARAIHDIELSNSLPASRRVVFRARQAELDFLIGEVEQLMMVESVSAPAWLINRVSRAVTQGDERVPSWLTANISPVTLLDHLLVCEGRLRRTYYHALVFDPEDE